jgi:hypothetical protein
MQLFEWLNYIHNWLLCVVQQACFTEIAREKGGKRDRHVAWWQSSWVSLSRLGHRSPVPAPASNGSSGKAIYLKKRKGEEFELEVELVKRSSPCIYALYLPLCVCSVFFSESAVEWFCKAPNALVIV